VLYESRAGDLARSVLAAQLPDRFDQVQPAHMQDSDSCPPLVLTVINPPRRGKH
jgi:hypothetical protein